MSTKSMKINKEANQRVNRKSLEKYRNSYRENTENRLADKQEEVANFTASTLRERVSTSWFEKNNKEREAVNLAKANYKHNKNTALRNEMLAIIAKSNPRYDAKLIIS